MTVPRLASIPSPPFNEIDIGPLSVHLYGALIGLAVIAGVTITARRWETRGGGRDDIFTLAMFAVPAGLVGARLYHVATDFSRFQGRWWYTVAVWEGGLGIFGAITGGALAVIIVARRRGWNVVGLLDSAAPALPVAQAIGRLGNWFNQELFGRPTDLPWALRIDADHRPAGLADVGLYHPTFLYEGLWNLALAGALLAIDRRWHPRPGQLFAGYVAGYATGRLWVESIRLDAPTDVLGGLRFNLWLALALLVVALAVIAVLQTRTPRPQDENEEGGEQRAGAEDRAEAPS